MKVRKLDGLSAGVRVGTLVYASDPLGVDWQGGEVREQRDVVIVSIDRQEDGWLISYREVHVRPELAPAP